MKSNNVLKISKKIRGDKINLKNIVWRTDKRYPIFINLY